MDKKSKKSSNKQANNQVVSISPTTQSLPDRIVLTTEQSDKITAADQVKLQARLNLADFEVYLSDLQDKKSELLSKIKSSSEEFMNVVREAAVANGIDPDGKQDDSKWNLDTNTMTFNRVK